MAWRRPPSGAAAALVLGNLTAAHGVLSPARRRDRRPLARAVAGGWGSGTRRWRPREFVESPTALLQPEPRAAVRAFLDSRTLPDPPGAVFVRAVAEPLSGLAKVTVTTGDLLAGGSPATPAEMKRRFADHLDALAQGRDPEKVRVVLE